MMQLESLITKWNDWSIRRKFNANARIDFYEAMSLLMENEVPTLDALKSIYNGYTDEGKHPNDARGIIITECVTLISEGKPLSESLRNWVNYQELTIIASGEKSGQIVESFSQATTIINAKQEIFAAIRGVVVYPAILLSLVCVVLNIVSQKLVPNLAKSSDPETWTGAAAMLYKMSYFVDHFGVLTLAAIVLLVSFIAASLPLLRGAVRIHLDRFPPWSIYRMLQSATFMLNVAVMQSAGIPIKAALEIINKHSNPWLKQRLDAAIYGISVGGNLGVALHKSGYEFPDKKAIQFLLILSSREGFENSLSKFANRWLKMSVKRIQTTSNLMIGVGIMAIGALLLVVVAGVFGIQDVIDSGMHR